MQDMRVSRNLCDVVPTELMAEGISNNNRYQDRFPAWLWCSSVRRSHSRGLGPSALFISGLYIIFDPTRVFSGVLSMFVSSRNESEETRERS